MGGGEPWVGALATVTHARLRAAQGDVEAARRILCAILEARPDDDEARSLLNHLPQRAKPRAEEKREEILDPPEPGDPAELATRFRDALRPPAADHCRGLIRRLEEYARRIGSGRSRPHAR